MAQKGQSRKLLHHPCTPNLSLKVIIIEMETNLYSHTRKFQEVHKSLVVTNISHREPVLVIWLLKQLGSG